MGVFTHISGKSPKYNKKTLKKKQPKKEGRVCEIERWRTARKKSGCGVVLSSEFAGGDGGAAGLGAGGGANVVNAFYRRCGPRAGGFNRDLGRCDRGYRWRRPGL